MAIITKNEEKMLPDCLRSVSFADDVVVVDSESTDRTVEIARDMGARVFVEQWKGYGPQKNSAVQKCLNVWVLILDADERIPEETKKKILDVLKNPAHDAYSLPRKNYFHGKWIRHSDWWPDRTVRLVKKTQGGFNSVNHEKWVANGSLSHEIQTPIEHHSFTDYSAMLKTLDAYSTAIAGELFSRGIRANALAPVYHGIGMFLKIYLLKLGFLDGFAGLVIALTKAGGSFFKYAKLLELQRREK